MYVDRDGGSWNDLKQIEKVWSALPFCVASIYFFLKKCFDIFQVCVLWLDFGGGTVWLVWNFRSFGSQLHVIDIALQLFTIGQLGFATNLVVFFFFLKNKTKKKKRSVFIVTCNISTFFTIILFEKMMWFEKYKYVTFNI